jgi:hypothetical protein
VNILQAIDDEHLFKRWFKDRATWQAWRVFLCALFGLPLEGIDAEILYEEATGRPAPGPTAPATEAWLICGRRAGKSFTLALIAVFLSCFFDYRRYLQPGERGTLIVCAADRRQARTIFRYVRGLLTGIPMLTRLIERETADSFDLTNSVSIEITTASFRSVRGYTCVAALCDEIAFWHSDESSANPDHEVLDALRPSMASIPNAMLLCASSPHSKRGTMWDSYKRFFAKADAPVLVWKAATRVMNPTVPQRIIDAAIERDAAKANAEYGAEFRNDLESFVPIEVVQACVVPGEIEAPGKVGRNYVAFVDPSGGTSDSMTLCIGHMDKDVVVIDVLRERKAPFDPSDVTDEFTTLLKTYRLSRVTGDRYAGEWPREQFRKRGITYVPSETPKSGLYLDLLPRLNSKTIKLLDNARAVNQIAGLERRTARGGKDSIDHAPGAHDDLANVVAGVASIAAENKGSWSRCDLYIGEVLQSSR